MTLDSIVLSALIGSIGAVVSVAIGIYSYIVQKNAERERAEFAVRREKYNEWLTSVTKSLHKALTKGQSSSSEDKEKFDVANSMLLLYGSDEVVKALQNYIDIAKIGQGTGSFQKIVLAMRKDLLKNTSLKESDVILPRAI